MFNRISSGSEINKIHNNRHDNVSQAAIHLLSIENKKKRNSLSSAIFKAESMFEDLK